MSEENELQQLTEIVEKSGRGIRMIMEGTFRHGLKSRLYQQVDFVEAKQCAEHLDIFYSYIDGNMSFLVLKADFDALQ